MITIVRTAAELEAIPSGASDYPLITIDGEHELWIAYPDDEGEWYATRPPTEDDPESTWGRGVTMPLDGLPLPLVVATPGALIDLASEADHD